MCMSKEVYFGRSSCLSVGCTSRSYERRVRKEKTEIKHTIDMNTYGKGTLMWTLVIRPLHNALIQDAFDKIENNLIKHIYII